MCVCERERERVMGKGIDKGQKLNVGFGLYNAYFKGQQSVRLYNIFYSNYFFIT